MKDVRIQSSLNKRQPARGPFLVASAVCALKLALTLILLGQLVEMGELGRIPNQNSQQISSLVATKVTVDDDFQGLIKWADYTKTFNKIYSSLQQQIVRHKLFLSNLMKVFVVFTKFKLKTIGYYLVINRFSDMAPHEQRHLLGGDSGETNADQEDDAIQDDYQIEQILQQDSNELLGSSNNLAERPGPSVKFRSKRDLTSRPHYLAPMKIQPILGLLDLPDLVRVPNKNDEAEQRKHLEIKWRVPAENPFYQPIELYTRGAADAEKPIEDIPKVEIEQIERETSGLLPTGVSVFSTLASSLGKSGIDLVARTLTSSADVKTTQVEEAAATATDHQKGLTVLYKDWRETGCVAPPYDQGYCNSCYAISATNFFEWAFCMNQGRVLTPLSAQYLVSCGPQFKLESDPKLKVDLYGCSRGRSRQAMMFFKEYGLELEVNMPYEADDTDCPINFNTPAKYKGYIRPNVKQYIRMAAKTKQLELALEKGPVIVNFREPIDFMAFGGGMVEGCFQRGGHSMLIIGHGIESGTPYLLIKNSFGTDWGDQGYFKFNRKYTEECIKDFILPRVSFPSKKAQARRIKAYDASKLNSIDNQIDVENFGIHMDKLAQEETRSI